eukprot:7198661-Lingulodinium_polyedra.AAC.1
MATCYQDGTEALPLEPEAERQPQLPGRVGGPLAGGLPGHGGAGEGSFPRVVGAGRAPGRAPAR